MSISVNLAPMPRRRAIALTTAVAMSMLLAAPVGVIAADKPDAFVQSIGDQVVKVLQQKLPRDQTEQQLNGIWLNAFDVQAIGRAVLGTHWRTANDEQRKAYMDVFPKYVAKVYAIQFSDYSGQTFQVGGSSALSGEQTLVHAKIVSPDKEPVKVDFVVQSGDQGMKIEDVKVEGVSLLITKRTEFDSVVAQKGIDGLIQAMRAKTG